MRLARDLAGRMRYFGVTEAYASFELEDAERELVARAYEALSGDDEEDDVRCVEAAEWLEEQSPDDPALWETIETLKAGGKEPLRPRVRFLDRNATDEGFEALVEAVDGEKRVYEGHVDGFEP